LGALYDLARKPERIWHAWAVIQENGRRSRSSETRAEVADFGKNAPKHISRIVQQLQRRTFRFAPSLGVPIAKKGTTKKRPLVLAPIPNRIVQRAILEVAQNIPSVQQRLRQGCNYGGVEGRGVPDAVLAAFRAAGQCGYFVRTDIKSFFDRVPRAKAVECVTTHSDDLEFNQLLSQASTTELSNLALLGRDKELFPLADIGVAQGSSLSPLLCNLLLADIDRTMNGRGIQFIRYIDDFIVFAPNRSKAMRALRSTRQMLDAFDLECYDPTDNPDKAEEGSTSDRFHFLGCEILVDQIRPSRESRDHLLARIDEVTERTLAAIRHPSRAILERKSYGDALGLVSNVVRGWGNTYAFCTDNTVMENLEAQIEERLAAFNRRFKEGMRSLSKRDRRRALGVFSLMDCNQDLTVREEVSRIGKLRRSALSRPPQGLQELRSGARYPEALVSVRTPLSAVAGVSPLPEKNIQGHGFGFFKNRSSAA
jgi:RNA-directed DNA polymerase